MGRKFKKINVEMKLIDGEIKKDKMGWNEITTLQYKITLSKGRVSTTYDVSLIKNINGMEYSAKYLEGLVLLNILESLKWAKEFNFFKDPEDIGNFAYEFGYDSCRDVIKVVNEIKKIAKVVKTIPLSEDELNRYYEISIEGEVDSVEQARDELVEKYFDLKII